MMVDYLVVVNTALTALIVPVVKKLISIERRLTRIETTIEFIMKVVNPDSKDKGGDNKI